MRLVRPPRFFRPGPVQFRQFLQERGPIFIKLGQYLALRPDILPETYCDELMRLLDRVPPFSWAEARTILTHELRRAPSDVFRYIDTNPAAAGSLAQVHRAVLKDGTEVAVKVQRPHIEEQVRRDLKRARMLARLLEAAGAQPGVSPREVVEELAEWLTQELDFRRELANLTRLHGLAIDSPVARIPRPFPHLSTARVLTSEYLHGIPFTDLLKAIRPGVEEEARPVDAPGIDFRELTRNLIVSTLDQIFRYQFFHADLHPGNLFACRATWSGTWILACATSSTATCGPASFAISPPSISTTARRSSKPSPRSSSPVNRRTWRRSAGTSRPKIGSWIGAAAGA